MYDHLKVLYTEIFRPLFQKMASLQSIRNMEANLNNQEWKVMEKWLKENEVYDYLNRSLYLPLLLEEKTRIRCGHPCENGMQFHHDNEQFKTDLNVFRKNNADSDIICYLSTSGITIPRDGKSYHKLSKALYDNFENLLKNLEFDQDEEKLFKCDRGFYFNLIDDIGTIYQKQSAFTFDLNKISAKFDWEKCKKSLDELNKIWFVADKEASDTKPGRKKRNFDARIDINKIYRTLWILSRLLPVVTQEGDLKSQMMWKKERIKLKGALFRFMQKQSSVNFTEDTLPQEDVPTLWLELYDRLFDKDAYNEVERAFLYEEYYCMLEIPYYKSRLQTFINRLDQYDEIRKKLGEKADIRDCNMEYQICSDIWNSL